VVLAFNQRVWCNAFQQSVQRTAGSLRDLQVFFWLDVFSALKLLSTPAPRPPLTQTVGTPLAKRKLQ
jgi:hypothetical protein